MGLPLQAKGTSALSSEPPSQVRAETKTVHSKPTPTQDISRSEVAITATDPDKSNKSVAKPAAAKPEPTRETVSRPVATVTPAASLHEKAKASLATTSETPAMSHPAASSAHEPSVASARAHTSTPDRSSTAGERLARVTAYWAGEGDYYTGRGMSSTGVHLHDGHCAVDPRIIPYGSVVDISGVGKYLAVDTGSAVISREAAKETGRNSEERNALVIDLFFESRADGERFAANGPKFASISWTSPRSTASTQDPHSVAAE